MKQDPLCTKLAPADSNKHHTRSALPASSLAHPEDLAFPHGHPASLLWKSVPASSLSCDSLSEIPGYQELESMIAAVLKEFP